MTPDEPTEEQLRLAYRQLHRPDRWPRTFEAALAHPVYGVCLRALARQLGRPPWAARTGTPPAAGAAAPVPPAPSAPPPRRTTSLQPQRPTWMRSPSPTTDRKRLAAGDRDD
ncbi:MAG: hypothetical protein AMXMBFR78_11590 [Rubrivivax sp.]